MLAYLGPHGVVHIHCIVAGLLLCRTEHSPPAAVPVVVDYNVHVGVQRPGDYLVHPVHQAGINGVVAAFVVHSVRPRHGNADSVESCGFHALYHFLRGAGLSPYGLEGSRVGAAEICGVIVGFQRIAEIYSVAHRTDNFEGSHSVALRFFRRCGD